ncbi:MAG: tape measure protein [Desulfovibrio sp.]
MAQNEISIIVTAKDVATKQLKAMGRAMDGLKSSVFSLQGVLAGIGVGAVAQGLVNTAANFENLDLSLRTITGSSAKAKEAMDWISEFTATTPYELEEVANAFKKLSSYGLEPTKYLKTLGDTASAMGKSLDTAVEMFADATTGEFERLKEFGIRAKTEGDKVTFSWMQNGKQMTKVVDKTGEALSNFLGETFQDRFGGGMELLSKGWSGMWSNLKDQVTLFAKAVMDSGVFEYMKERLSEILSTLTQMTKDGSLKELAKDIGTNMVAALDAMLSGFRRVKDFFESLPEGTGAASMGGYIGAKLFGPVGMAFFASMGFMISNTMSTIERFKKVFSSDDITLWDKMMLGLDELETKLDQANAQRLAKEQANIAQMDALDDQRTANLLANYKSHIEAEAATAEQIKSIQSGLAEFKAVKWDEITKNIKAKLKDLETEEKKYSDQVKKLQDQRAAASLSTEEKVRSLLRTTMSDYDAYQDKLKQANESLSKAKLALSGGDGELAASWAKKAQEQFADLNTEIKDGENTLVTAAQANAIAVTGVLDAGRALEQGILIQEQAAEATRKTLAEQVDQAKTDLQTIKEMQGSVAALEMQLSANDEASPVLTHIQQELAKIKDKTVTVTTHYVSTGDKPGRAAGGMIPGFNRGGRLPGYSLKDNMLAMVGGKYPIGLAGGEFITNAMSTRLLSRMMPGLLESLNRVRSAGDLSKILGAIPGRAGGGPVGAYRFTFASAGQEATISTNNRAEADGLLALTRAMSKHKLVHGS